MRPSRFAFVLSAVFATATLAHAPHNGPEVIIKLPARVMSLALSATSNRAAIVTGDSKLTLWSLDDGRVLRAIALGTADIDVTAISEDGRWIFTGDHAGNGSLWDADTGQAKLQLRLPHYPAAVCFSHDSKFIAIAPMGEAVEVFDVAAARMLYQTNPVAGGTAALAFSRDGTLFATADADTEVRIYHARTGKLISVNGDFLLEPLAVDFTSDGRQVIAGGGDKSIAFINVSSGKLIRRLQKSDEPVSFCGLKLSPDGSIVAALLMKAENMDQPAPVVKWEVSSGQKKSQWTPATLALCLDWTRDGQLISAGPDSDSVHVWRVP